MESTLDITLFRPPSPEDAQRTHELRITCDIHEYGAPDSDLRELKQDWDEINLKRNAWLATSPEDILVGYAAVIPWGKSQRFDLYVTPSRRGTELCDALLEKMEARAAEMAREQGSPLEAVSFVAATDPKGKAVLERYGYECNKHHFQMQTTFSEKPNNPKFPRSLILRTIKVGEDDEMVHDLIQTSFGRVGDARQPFEEWRSFMIREETFVPELWFLAFEDYRMVAACLCFEYEDLGWVRQLGVLDGWRRRGIGSAMLLHAFNRFYERGLPKAGLALSADNENAFKLYEKVGMRLVRQYDEYSKTFPAK